jgi:hypothetical protein
MRPSRPRRAALAVLLGSTALALAALLVTAGRSMAAEYVLMLPRSAAEAVKALFPKARVTHVGRGRKRGAWYYEVTLKEGDRRFTAEVSDEGTLGEVVSVMRFEEVPAALQETIRQRVANGRLRAVERHERHGTVRAGRFVPLKTPQILYQVSYTTAAGEKLQFEVTSGGIQELPAAVVQAVQASFPGTVIAHAGSELDDGVLLFNVELTTRIGTVYAGFSRDGQLLEQEVPCRWEDAPASIGRAIGDAARQNDVKLLLKRDTAATVKDGKVVESRQTAYVARLTRGDRMREFVFDGRGRQTSKSEWLPVESAGGKDDGGNDGG